MQALLVISGWIDRGTERIGRLVYWLVLVVSLISAFNATMRFTIDYSSNAYLEIQWYLFSAIFLLGGGYTLLRNEHVRIDILSSRLSPRGRAWIDVFGLLVFLLPMAWLFISLGIPYVEFSIRTGEVSANAGGLIRWPVKILIPIGFTLLVVQALSELIKRLAFIAGRIPDPTEKHGLSSEEQLARELAGIGEESQP